MSKIRIEILAIGQKKIYSVGAVEVSPKGEVYLIHKSKGEDFHTSRHASGETHWKLKDEIIKVREGSPMKDFKGIEFLGTQSFGLESLPIFGEYHMKKCNGIFAFDMRDYKHAMFNLSIAILTEEGLPRLFESWKKLRKRQIYAYTDSHPMVAIMIADAKKSADMK